MYKKIAIIACDNGLGHLRRCYLLALKFANNNSEVTIFASNSKFRKFQNLFGEHKEIKNFNLSAGGNLASSVFQKNSTLNWIKYLPSLNKYCLVISDNLPEILILRPDAVLSGHFFWHEINHYLPRIYIEYCKELINKHQPLVIGTDLFSSNFVKNCKNYKPTGIYVYGKTDFNQQGKDSILITGGSTSLIRNELNDFYKKVIKDERFKHFKIYVDNQILNNSKNNIYNIKNGKKENTKYLKEKYNNIIIAEYNKQMYKRVHIALCRAGVGTLSDLLQFGCYPICFYDNENKEIQNNINCLERSGLGRGIDINTNPDQLIMEIEQISEVKNSFLRKLSNENFHGSEISYKILLNR